jgi:hypothetical protein
MTLDDQCRLLFELFSVELAQGELVVKDIEFDESGVWVTDVIGERVWLTADEVDRNALQRQLALAIRTPASDEAIALGGLPVPPEVDLLYDLGANGSALSIAGACYERVSRCAEFAEIVITNGSVSHASRFDFRNRGFGLPYDLVSEFQQGCEDKVDE